MQEIEGNFKISSRVYRYVEIASNVQTTEGYHSLVCQEKYMPNALKGNTEK